MISICHRETLAITGYIKPEKVAGGRERVAMPTSARLVLESLANLINT